MISKVNFLQGILGNKLLSIYMLTSVTLLTALTKSKVSLYLQQLVTHAQTRNEALDLMNKALDSYVIRGTDKRYYFIQQNNI